MHSRSLFRSGLMALSAGLALALSGCISFGGGKGPDSLFTLTAETSVPAGSTASGTAAEALVVLDPETDRRLAVQRVAVAVDPSNVAYLKKAMWVERPTRLFRSLLAETIRAKGGRLVFEDNEGTASGRLRLAGRLLDLGYDGPTRTVVVRYDAVLEKPGGEVSTKRFEARINGVDPESREAAPALNRAANDVARQVADWIG
ncbi:ABC-type transport auxiliary lipoprotein family protein [Novosphingobium flavum]|nr:ABC-type transport auxiliary lipoprotein family protein [Novosphingobium flavum]